MNRFLRVLPSLISLLSLTALAAAAPQFVPEDPAGFFVDPNVETTLVWKFQGPAKAGPPGFHVSDINGDAILEGKASLAEGKVSATVRLPRGYYDIELGGEKFGIVAQDAFAGKPDGFYGMDAVLTWLEHRAPLREAMVRAMKRCGIAMARERINWNAVEPQPGQWNWQADEIVALREQYAAAGISVLEMFHSAGPAKGKDLFPFPTSYPQDLAQVRHSWPVIQEKLAATWGGLEMWNEPEGSTYGKRLPADQYAMIVKAMRYTWAAEKLPPPLGGGVFMGGDPGDFHKFCALNGVIEASDFISIHDYKPATTTERQVAVHRAWLKENGRESMPIWMTESGWSWPKGGGRPLLAADRESALHIAMKGVEAKACGIARYMPFCLAFYEEGGAKSFSMLGKDVTPLRSMAGYAQSIRALAGKRYVGDLPVDVPRARVFEDEAGGQRVAVLYTGEIGAPAKIALPAKIIRAEGLDGRALTPDAEGRIAVPDGIAYAWIEGGTLLPDTRAMALLKVSRQPVPPAPAPSPIVLQYLPDPKVIAYSSTRYLAAQEASAALPIRVRVHNLSGELAKLDLRLTLPGETPAESTAPRQVEIPALGTAEAAWTVDVRHRWKSPEPLPITITATDPDSRLPSSVLAIPMQIEGGLDLYLPHYGQKMPLEISDAARWSPNLTATGAMKVEAAEAQGVKLRFTFKGGDRWAYPRFRLEDRALAGATGFVLRARVENPADVRMTLLGKQGVTYITSDPLIPSDGKWHVLFVPLRQFEPNQDAGNQAAGDWAPEDIRAVSVGLNDRSENSVNLLEISDLIVVGPAR